MAEKEYSIDLGDHISFVGDMVGAPQAQPKEVITSVIREPSKNVSGGEDDLKLQAEGILFTFNPNK